MSLTTQERQIVDAQVARALACESGGNSDNYTFDRDGSAYNGLLLGIGETLRYVAQLPSKLVVDLGCGTSNGIYDISKSYGGLGLTFRATSLKRHEAHGRFIGNDRVDIDTVESLDSYKNSSVGCFLAVFSLAYSRVPRIAIKTIRGRLCNGGVLKAVFQNQYVPGKYGEQSMNDFYNACLENGFDVAVMYPDEYGPETLLAVKKPLQKGITAKQLIDSDFQGMMEMISGSRKK